MQRDQLTLDWFVRSKAVFMGGSECGRRGKAVLAGGSECGSTSKAVLRSSQRSKLVDVV